MNLIDAVQGPFSNWLGDLDEWKPWFPFLKTLSGEPLTDDELKLFQSTTGRTTTFAKPVQEAWLVVGRRGRKSAIAALIGVHAAVFRDWTACIAPGETARVLIVAVDKEQAGIVKSYADALLESDNELARMKSKKGNDKETIALNNGIEIKVVTNSFRSVRGPACVCAIFEELAFWRSDESANPDKEVLRAVRPSMLTTKKYGALLLGLSSPYAKRGLLYERHRDHHGEDESKIMVWQADTLTMNPSVDREEIDEAYKDDPEAAAAEYGAQFRTDICNFLDADLVASLTRGSPVEIPPQASVKYVAFVDPSGGRGDSMTIAIAHNQDGVNVIDVAREVRAPFDPATVVSDFAELLKAYHLREVTGDHYSGEWVVSAFKDHGVAYKNSDKNKSAIYMEVLPMFSREQVELPPVRRLAVQLAQLERRTARGGRDSVDHPLRGSDDLANSVCGAAHLASKAQKKPPKAMPLVDLRDDYLERREIMGSPGGFNF